MTPDPTPYPLDHLALRGARNAPALTISDVTITYAELEDAVGRNAGLPLSNNLLAGAAASFGQSQAAAAYEKQADRFTPADPFFHWMVGLRLQNVGMNALAEKHFQRAVQLDPQFRARFQRRN